MKENNYFIEARKLKIMLSCKYEFLDWMKRNIDKNKLVENIDFILDIKEKNNYYLKEEAAQKIILSYPNNKTAQRIIKEIENGKSLKKILNDLYDLDIRVIKISDDKYPKQLKQIKNPPKQIYVKGDIENLNKPGLAVIGTRKCSNYGRKNCKSFTKGLVSYNLTIISGLAIGIDTCAHKSCLEVKGKTIAVLPSGLRNVFPKENKQLVNEIIKKGGTVISEYPPDFEKNPDSCRKRNRIVSALGIGTLVIEAGKKTGTSITVNYANEQEKKVFCIPAGLQNPKGIGTNGMIKEGRAKMITEVEDIIKEYPELELKKIPDFNIDNVKTKKNKKKKIEIDEENLEIYNLLSKEPKHINEISKLINQPISEITYKLTMLELQGAIEELPGKKFKIKEERK